MKLHLGCGTVYKEGWVNVDFLGEIADQLVDLSRFPWPWESGSADEVYLEHVIEHFERPEFVIKEIHRVLKPGGSVTVITPHRDSVSATAIDHKAFMSYCFFACFIGTPDHHHYWPEQNQNCWFELISYRVLILKQPSLKWTPFDYVASRFPYFWEKFSFGLLRPTEITWTARKPVSSE